MPAALHLPRGDQMPTTLRVDTTGKDYRADDAPQVGAIDAVVASDALHTPPCR